MLVIFEKQIVNYEPELIHLIFQFFDLVKLIALIASTLHFICEELLFIVGSLIHDEDGSIVRLAYALYLLYCLNFVL